MTEKKHFSKFHGSFNDESNKNVGKIVGKFSPIDVIRGYLQTKLNSGYKRDTFYM